MNSGFIQGPDISFYQDDPTTPFTVDFRKMLERAYWVVIRAGQNLWGDRDFKRNWQEAKKAGIPRGSYWFYDSRVDPKKQADKFFSMFDGDFGELPVFGDFEDSYNGPFKGWKNWYNFLERLKELLPEGKEVGIYTGYYYWRENTVGLAGGIPTASLEYFKPYPLWIANYGVSQPMVPAPWKDWLFWQYTDNGDGTLYGVESLNIDLNHYKGTPADFYKRFNLSNTPTKPEGEETPTTGVIMYTFERAGTAGAALRNAPKASGVLKPYLNIPSTLLTSAGYITDGTPVKGDVIVPLTEDIIVAGNIIGLKNDKWLHVVEVGGYVVDGYTAIVHKGVSQGVLTEIDVEVPDPQDPPTTPTLGENVIVNVNTEERKITVTTEKNEVWKVYVDGFPYQKV